MNTQAKQKITVLCECGVLIALATVLSFIKIWDSPLGGSVTLLSMLPIMLISMRNGLKWGFGGAFVYSVIQLITGINTVGAIPTTAGIICSILFDYLVPFTLLGVAGVFMKDNFKTKGGLYGAIIGGIALAVVLRFICHFVVGALLWYEITKLANWGDPWDTYVNTYGMWGYSFIYQIIYLGPDSALIFLTTPILPRLVKMRLTK